MLPGGVQCVNVFDPRDNEDQFQLRCRGFETIAGEIRETLDELNPQGPTPDVGAR